MCRLFVSLVIVLLFSFIAACGAQHATIDSDGDADGDADVSEDADVELDSDVDDDTIPCEHPPVVEECSGGWCRIPAGCFTMGSSMAEWSHVLTRETEHEVTLTRDFEILSTEVTQALFEAVMGYNYSEFEDCGADCPVERVDWYEAAAFCNALSAEAGLAACYDCNGGDGMSVVCTASESYPSPYDCPGYRLPTEAEWEYAARAGTTTETYNGTPGAITLSCAETPVLNPISWYCFNSGGRTHAVAQLAPNGWGLYDMLGNVREWCHERWLEDLGTDAVIDPDGPESGAHRVIRGGSYGNGVSFHRAASRYWSNRINQFDSALGFRPVRSL